MSLLWKKKNLIYNPVLWVKKKLQQIVYDENGKEVTIKKFREGILHYKFNSNWYDVTVDERYDFVSNGIAQHDTFTSELDGDMVKLSYRNFIIRKGHIVTTTQRCKGLSLNVETLLVSGTLSMTARGAHTEGRYVGINYLNHTIDISETAEENPFDGLENTYIIGPRGGEGNTGQAGKGGAGINGACGSGGGTSSRAGGYGTSFSGGSGAGGYSGYVGSGGTSGNGQVPEINGGKGGLGGCSGTNSGGSNGCGGGGAGNPGNTTKNRSGKIVYASNGFDPQAESGTGGLLIIFCNTLYFSKYGLISSNGCKGGDGIKAGAASTNYGGGGSGGGAIHIFHKNLFNNYSNVKTTGGKGGKGCNTSWNDSPSYHGSDGGDGTVNLFKLD